MNVDAEKSALGAAIISAEAYAKVTSDLIVDDFSAQAHRLIFTAMTKMYADGKPLDAVTLMDALGRDLDAVGGMSYITELSLYVPSAANVDYYIGILREDGRKRRLLVDLERVVNVIQSGDTDVDYLEQTEAAIQKAHSRTAGTVDMVSKYALDAFKEIFEGKQQGMSTGFIVLDQTMGGLRKGHVCVVAGRPAMGKTSFAVNVSTNVVRAGGTAVFFTLEQPCSDIIKRALISTSGCSEYDAQARRREQMDRLGEMLDDMSKWRWCVVDNAYTLIQIREKCYAVKRQEKALDLVVIDYLQLIKTNQRKGGTREQEVAELSRSIKLLARELDCPVILLSQLSRAPETRTDKKPMLSDLRDSGSIEQDADEVLFLYRPYVYDRKADPQEAVIIVSKNRNGDTGEIDARWSGEYFRYSDIIMQEVSQVNWEEI